MKIKQVAVVADQDANYHSVYVVTESGDLLHCQHSEIHKTWKWERVVVPVPPQGEK